MFSVSRDYVITYILGEPCMYSRTYFAHNEFLVPIIAVDLPLPPKLGHNVVSPGMLGSLPSLCRID